MLTKAQQIYLATEVTSRFEAGDRDTACELLRTINSPCQAAFVALHAAALCAGDGVGTDFSNWIEMIANEEHLEPAASDTEIPQAILESLQHKIGTGTLLRDHAITMAFANGRWASVGGHPPPSRGALDMLKAKGARRVTVEAFTKDRREVLEVFDLANL
jgi:hypothetical protein